MTVFTFYYNPLLIFFQLLVAGSLAAKSCFNLLDPEGRSTLKRGGKTEQMIRRISTTSKYQPNETLPFDITSSDKHYLKGNDSHFNHPDEMGGDRSTWSKNRILKSAKSTPSLLHINDEPIKSASVEYPSPSCGLDKSEGDDSLRQAFSGECNEYLHLIIYDVY